MSRSPFLSFIAIFILLPKLKTKFPALLCCLLLVARRYSWRPPVVKSRSYKSDCGFVEPRELIFILTEYCCDSKLCFLEVQGLGYFESLSKFKIFWLISSCNVIVNTILHNRLLSQRNVATRGHAFWTSQIRRARWKECCSFQYLVKKFKGRDCESVKVTLNAYT